MNIFLRVGFITLLPAGLLAAVIHVGCRQQLSAKPSIPIDGAVYHVHRPDGSHTTYFDIAVGQGFEGKLPDDIDAIAVAGPKGDLSIGKSDFRVKPMCMGLPTLAASLYEPSYNIRPGDPRFRLPFRGHSKSQTISAVPCTLVITRVTAFPLSPINGLPLSGIRQGNLTT